MFLARLVSPGIHFLKEEDGPTTMPELQRLFRDKGARREEALLGLLILAVAMVISPRFIGISKPLISKTGLAEPARQPLKNVVFRRIG